MNMDSQRTAPAGSNPLPCYASSCGRVTLYHADCRDVIGNVKADAVITDPPYGIGKDGQHKTTGGHGGRKAYDFLGWDASRPPCELLTQLAAASPYVIMWGGNYFGLPPSRVGWFGTRQTQCPPWQTLSLPGLT